ncbi:MAG TPA: energy transducer TonB [Thermoanaerobaculia bacterium]|nr:energy transducer TonB [Thermoanaerobaculia bacterium]
MFPIVVAIVLTLSAHGQTAARWARDIDKSSAHLKAGEFDRSLKISERLLRQMIDELGSGEAATRFFGTALTHKALALAGLGRNEDALWHWHTVLTLYPPFEKSNLSSFGDAGAFLTANRNPRIPDGFPEEGKRPPDLKPPVVLRKVAPDFPPGAQYFGAEGLLIVNVIIRTDGTVTAPVVRKALPAPTLSYVALEAIRKWKFRPAMKSGEPIEVQFDLTLNYKP